MTNVDTSVIRPGDAPGILEALGPDGIRSCADDIWFFTKFVKTRDEADEESIKSFPRLDYLHEFYDVLNTSRRIAVAKSRQMFVSWALCVYCVWFARFHPHKYVVWQTQKLEDAVKMVSMPGDGDDTGYMARMQFVEHSLPSWLQVNAKFNSGLINYPNGSLIEAVAGGANQVRGKTASLLIEDEFAYQEEAKGVYQAVAPLIQKATKFVAVSTPNGPDNTFAEIFHGYRLVSYAD